MMQFEMSFSSNGFHVWNLSVFQHAAVPANKPGCGLGMFIANIRTYSKQLHDNLPFATFPLWLQETVWNMGYIFEAVSILATNTVEFPITTIQWTNVTSLEPARNAVEMECMLQSG
jgi:hypothetical protein